jgi:uncharacterized protein (TIGR04255 family)
MTKNIPSRLNKAPIIDSIFEIRYTSPQHISTILPGILHGGLEGEKKVLPVPPIPVEIIMSDPNMQSAPTFSIEWGNYIIAGNPYYVAVSYKPPYARWENFKEGIAIVHKVLISSKVFAFINRYSIKYVDFIDENESITPMDFLDIKIDIHNNRIRNENVSLHVELPQDNYVHILKVATSATIAQVANPDVKRKGLLIDTDTICSMSNPLSPENFLFKHNELLNDIHRANKDLFFRTLSQYGIEHLEPVYE